MQISKSNTAYSAIVGIYRLLIISFIILTLYFAQTIVIPLTLAALLTFLLSPLVTRLEKWIGRIFSILIIVIVAFSTIGFAGYVFIRQLLLFASNFENYYVNIQKKFKIVQFPQSDIFDRIGHAFESLKNELLGESNSVGTHIKFSEIDLSSSLTKIVEWFSSSFFNILGSAGIVLLLVIFMLLNREDIRGRIIKLIGPHSISSTTSTMEDASDRVYDYLFRQLIVNIGFGICVSTGLLLIGVPNAILWGCFAAILRFIPYIGAWIAAILPISLSLIITDTWTVPFLTISLFIILEIITAYFIEPFYYGLGTGVSSFALILAAIFWTWLWGPIGLFLSTPLTVCLVVLGQHVTNINFLSVLLSHEKALTPEEECYHRLLSSDTSASMDFVESYLKEGSIISLYDSVLIPIITKTEIDFNQDLIDADKKEGVYQNIHEILELLSINEKKETLTEPKGKVLCLPARTIRDELGVDILTQLLVRESFIADQTKKLNLSDIFELVEKKKPDVVCIVVVAPFVLSHTRYLCTNLRQRIPQLPIVIGLLGISQVAPEIVDKLNSAGATKIVFSLSQAVETLDEMRSGLR